MPEVEPQGDDRTDYERARFRAAREAGLTKLEADRFARGGESLQTLRKLRADGCPPAVIARIVV